MINPDENYLADIAFAAVATSAGQSTIRRWVKAGVITPVRTRPVMVWTEDVRAAIQKARATQHANLDKRHTSERALASRKSGAMSPNQNMEG